jgi:8-oxo-dGTP diphosphatase
MTNAGSPLRSRAIIAVHVLLEKENQYLLLRRFNTGYFDGAYSLPAGHVEEGESAQFAAKREALEEIGIDISGLEMLHVMHHKSDTVRIALFFIAKGWMGVPSNREPHKCDHLAWFPKRALPDNIVPYVRFALQEIEMKMTYSEYGW